MSATHAVQSEPCVSTASSSPDANRLSRQSTQEATESAVYETRSSEQASRTRRVGRSTSYYHHFQTKCHPSNDPTPSYSVSARMSRFPPSPRHLDGGNEILPKYTCTVSREGPMCMRLEKISPFQYLPSQEWRDVYVVLRGTQLNVHKVKTVQLAGQSFPTAGKVFARYTLQHAEIGLAPDVDHQVLQPTSRLARFIPTPARRRAFEKDPSLFKAIPQTAMRLRLDAHQILLAHASEECVFGWISSLSAGIDISLPIDDRSAPRPCTIPRRRRRQPQPAVDNIHDRTVIEEQERILRDMYPSLARSAEEPSSPTELYPTETLGDGNRLTPAFTNNDQDGEDIDLSSLAEEIGPSQDSMSRPVSTRQTTSSTTSMSPFQVNSTGLDSTGKWAPIHGRSQLQQYRYTRRCQPILLYNAPRASTVIMCHGRRQRINTRMDMLEEWELAPPSYDAHDFTEGLNRTNTMASSLATTSTAVSGSSINSQVGSQTGKAADMQSLQRSDTKTPINDHKTIHHAAPSTNGKMPERTLMEEGIVVTAF